jgi:hypothetical protein
MTLYTYDSQQDSPVIQVDLYDNSVPPEYRIWQSNVSIRFYNKADFADSPFIEAIFEQLQTLIAWQPTLESATTSTGDHALPILPRQDLSQVLRWRPRYVKTESVTGISYITYMSFGVGPIAEDGYLYTFQGLSNDGSTYVSVFAHLKTLALPPVDPNDDYDTFAAGYDAYLADALTLLNATTADQFTPNLDDLDALVQTIEVK